MTRRVKRITIRKRRRREGKTDYKARLNLLASGLPRIVIRKSNKYITVQVIESEEAKDFVVCSANSKELEKFGWKAGKKNLPASYLTCFLLGKKCNGKIKKAILDIGLQRSTKGSRIYACLKGALDAGFEIPHSKEMLPKEERLKGLHINKELEKSFTEVKEKIAEGQK